MSLLIHREVFVHQREVYDLLSKIHVNRSTHLVYFNSRM